jgi:hypothetical protein
MNETREQPRIPGGRVARVAPLLGMAGRTAGEAVAASLRKRRRGGDLTEVHTRQADRYVARLGNSGGVSMKALRDMAREVSERIGDEIDYRITARSPSSTSAASNASASNGRRIWRD